MNDYNITHSRKDSSDTDRRLDGFTIAGHGYHDIDKVIGFVKNPENRFWVSVQMRKVRVEVRQHAAGREFLATESDGFPPNNLLALPDC